MNQNNYSLIISVLEQTFSYLVSIKMQKLRTHLNTHRAKQHPNLHILYPLLFLIINILFFSKKTLRTKTSYSQNVPIRKLLSVQSLSCVRLSATPWTATRQAPLSSTNYQSLLKLMSIASVMPSNHLILCQSLLLPPSIFPSIRVFSNESVLRIR